MRSAAHSLPGPIFQKLRDAGIAVHDSTRKGIAQSPSNQFPQSPQGRSRGRQRRPGWRAQRWRQYLGKSAKIRPLAIRTSVSPGRPNARPIVLRGRLALGDQHLPRWIGNPTVAGGEPPSIVSSGPADELETAALMFTHALNSAQSRIWIASPTLSPTSRCWWRYAIGRTARGGRAHPHPDKPDHLLVYLAAFSYFDDSSKTGSSFTASRTASCTRGDANRQNGGDGGFGQLRQPFLSPEFPDHSDRAGSGVRRRCVPNARNRFRPRPPDDRGPTSTNARGSDSPCGWPGPLPSNEQPGAGPQTILYHEPNQKAKLIGGKLRGSLWPRHDLTPSATGVRRGAQLRSSPMSRALYLKTKNFHWHMSGPHFRDYHL